MSIFLQVSSNVRSAAIPRIYRKKFHRDIYKDLRDLQKGIDKENPEWEMTTSLLLLRAVQLGVQISEMDLLTIGTVLDMYMELQRDDEPHDQIASQDDMNKF